MLILQTLAKHGELHGFEIAEAIDRTSSRVLQVEEGSLYPSLQRFCCVFGAALAAEAAPARGWGQNVMATRRSNGIQLFTVQSPRAELEVVASPSQ